ncbi:TetR/AcrR family transcriptional regulator [soil metagenome]
MSAAERREQILAVTKGVADAEGFHAISLERIAREAGITRPIVYQHFGDLNGLLTALVEEEGQAALAQLDNVTPAGPLGEDPVEELLSALRSYLEAVASDPARWRLVLMPPEGSPPVLRERIAEGRGAVVAQLAEYAAPFLRPGGSPQSASPDIELTALWMSMLSDDAARLLLTEPEKYPIDRQIAHTRWLLQRISPGAAVPRAD